MRVTAVCAAASSAVPSRDPLSTTSTSCGGASRWAAIPSRQAPIVRAASRAGTMTLTRTPALTVAVCTYRRPLSLARALTALAVQEGVGVDWEVLVVDNEPAPGAEATVAAHAAAS